MMYVSNYTPMLPVKKRAQISPLSTQQVIELVKQTRNNLIRHYQENCIIAEHFRDRYALAHVSDLKVQFLKRDLTDLINEPLDLAHYSSVIKDIKESNNTDRINSVNYCQLFKVEIDNIFKKYIY